METDHYRLLRRLNISTRTNVMGSHDAIYSKEMESSDWLSHCHRVLIYDTID